jgi:signal transduction histidine kinase
VGEFSGTDRVNLFIFNGDCQTIDSIYEWRAEGVELRINETEVHPIPAFTPWIDRLRNDEVINISDVSKIPLKARAELEILQGQDVKSILILPINTAGELSGLMVLGFGFNNGRPTGEWSDGNIQLLRMASDTIGAALERMRTEKELRNTREAQAYAQGRLEIVDTILHNIGNAINSVTIGTGTIQESLANSRLTQHLLCLANAIKEHQGDFIDYVKNDPQGQKVAPFIVALANDFAKQGEELAKTVSRVRERAEHIADIIRTEKMLGRRSVYRKDVNLREAIDNAITVLQDSIGKRDIEISIEQSNAPKEISTQESQFHQMLVNLIKNSIEAIDDLGTSEGLNGTSFIKIRCYVESDSFILEVTDNGIGIEKDNLDVIFRSGYTTKDSGSGLGLHLIANFVGGCGGQIQALSDGVGKGATMRVALPLSSASCVNTNPAISENWRRN